MRMHCDRIGIRLLIWYLFFLFLPLVAFLCDCPTKREASRLFTFCLLVYFLFTCLLFVYLFTSC